MKILYTTDQLYLHGGIEKVLSQKANYLTDVEGDEVIVVTCNQDWEEKCYNFSERVKFYDLAINYEIEKSYFHPNNLKKIPKHIFSLKKILNEVKPDVLVSCSFGTDFFFLPFIKREIPKVKEFHASRFFSSKQNSLKKNLISKISAFVAKKYSQIVVLNPDEEKFYNSSKISVIPNPSEKSDYRSDFKTKKVMAAGRISPVKNFGELIEIWEQVVPEFPEWELHFYGEDYLGTQKELEKLVKKLGLQKNIKFMGVTKSLKWKMQEYSIYAMTSETECFPMVLLEALSVGLPVVSYDSPTGPKFIVKDDSDSFLVQYKNMDDFVKKLSNLMRDENLRKQMGENATQNIKRLEIGKIIALWKKLFERLAK